MQGTGAGCQVLDAGAVSVVPTGIQECDQEDSTRVLERLSCLPTELQDAVIGYLPLADILVWEKLNRHFCYRVRLGRLRERALGRALGAIFARDAFSRANHDRLLGPWLAGFAANPLGPHWPRALFCPDTLCGAVIRTLKETPRLALTAQASFKLPGYAIDEPAFSPTGNYMTIRTFVRSRDRAQCSPVHVFSWSGTGWQHGSPFAGIQGAYGLCFAADERQVAVAREDGLSIWKKTQDRWHQTACLPCASLPGGFRLRMCFSPDGASLLLQGLDGHQSVWNRDDGQHWQPGGHFFFDTGDRDYARDYRESAFSPDSRWLSVYCGAGRFVLYSRRADGDWGPHSPLEPASRLMAGEAFFRPGHREVFLRLEGNSLSIWRWHAGRWSETGAIHHPKGIYRVCFSADGQHLVTGAREYASLLWAEDSEGQWTVQHSLYRVDPERDAFSFVHFAAAGQSLIAGNLFRDADETDSVMLWVRDSGGRWRCRSEDAGGFLGADSLTPCRDGQHLVLLTRTQVPQARHCLRLLGRQGRRWVVKAERAWPRSPFCREVVIDPFCCHLAVTSLYFGEGGPCVEFVRVQQAPPPD